MNQSKKPTITQILVALLAAALIPALIVGLVSISFQIITLVFFVTAAHTLLLGLPIVLLLNKFSRLSLTSS